MSGDSVDVTTAWYSEGDAGAVRGYAVNITAVGATRSGVLTAWAGADAPKPTVSTVNYEVGVTALNMAVVPARYSSTETGFRVQNTAGTHVIIDLVGYHISDDGSARPSRRRRPSGSWTRATGPASSGAPRCGRDPRPQRRRGDDADLYVVVEHHGGPADPVDLPHGAVRASDRPSASNLNVSPGRVRSVRTYDFWRSIT